MASNEIIVSLLPKYLNLGLKKSFKGNLGSLPNIKKKGASLECSLGNALYTEHTNGTISSHSIGDVLRQTGLQECVETFNAPIARRMIRW